MVPEIIRWLVFAAFLGGAGIAVGSWAVTTRRISPFGRLARVIRRVGDPTLAPIERYVHARGGNPRNAPWWLLGIVTGGGLLVLTVTQWLAGVAANARIAAGSGPLGIVRVLVFYAGQLLSLALLVRVLGSWIGAGRYNPWMRPFYRLTDWIVEPLRKIIPPIGIFDITPLVAWVLVQLGTSLLVGWLGRLSG